jgi:hypothetical protein
MDNLRFGVFSFFECTPFELLAFVHEEQQRKKPIG